MKEKIKSTIQEKGAELVWGTVAFLLVATVHQIAAALPDSWFMHIPSKPLLLLLAISVVVNIIFGWVIIALLRDEKLTLDKGVFWDRKQRPYCPACKTPLCDPIDQPSETRWQCVKCSKRIPVSKV